MARKSCPSPPRLCLSTATWPSTPQENGRSVPVGAVGRTGCEADPLWPGQCGPGRHHAYRPSCLCMQGHRRGKNKRGEAVYCPWQKTDGQQAAISGRDTGTTTIYVRCGLTQPDCLRLCNRVCPPLDVHDLTLPHRLSHAARITETVEPCSVLRPPSACPPVGRECRECTA